IEVLGSGSEVGRSSIVVSGKIRIVMDCGVKIQPEPPKYPPVEKVDAAIISHAHLDHVGATPLLFKKAKIPVYMNDITLELGTMLVKDSMKVARKEGFTVPFDKSHVKRMVKNTKIIRHNEKFRIGEMQCSLWHSGHIPGSSSIMVDGGKKIFYTADIQTRPSHLLNPCNLPQKVDTLIIESTYGMKVQAPRAREEQRLVDAVEETIANDAVALMPVFAVGRAQEVMMILKDYIDKIALDGMAKLASEIVAQYGAYIKSPKEFRELLKKTKFIRTDEERAAALRKFPIIIASAGMLGGGPAVHYLREMQSMPEGKVLFTGFLVEDSPGRNLIETKIFENAEERFHVSGDLQQIELSAHADRNGLLDIIRRTRPETVICVHGDKCSEFAKSVEEEFRVQAFAPKNGETIKV
ncbi:MAG: MBL fold metallo-hydrolase, partial [Candidatus Aenigmarchaeota archaeon]|nr:MBL fold metallo-hydrolase [Candidatus Aenigmarchaeota archaeon]